MPDEKLSTVKTRHMSKSSGEDNEPNLLSLDKKLNSILSALETNSTDIKNIQREQRDLAASVEYCHNTVKDLSESLKLQNVKVNQCINDIEEVKQAKVVTDGKVRVLERRLDEQEQYSHRNNLVIYGIPEATNENILNVVGRLAAVIKFEDWSVKLVDAVHRMGPRVEGKSRPIIVKFISRLDRDLFLQKRKNKSNLLSSDLGYAMKNSVFVNESLTAQTRKLLSLTRDTAKKRGYDYVWTFNCSVFVRKTSGTPARKILSEEDLVDLC